MSQETEKPGANPASQTTTQITTDKVSTEPDEDDGFISLSDLRKDKDPLTAEQIAEMERQIAEEDAKDAEDDSFSPEQWNEYRNQVVRRWNEDDQRKVRYANKILALLDKHGDKIDKKYFWAAAQQHRSDHALDVNEEFENSPPIISLIDCLSVELPEPPQIIHGVLYRGGKLVVGGPSKIGKTFITQDLAVSVANGLPWVDRS
jgi:RecA-family ATPase